MNFIVCPVLYNQESEKQDSNIGTVTLKSVVFTIGSIMELLSRILFTQTKHTIPNKFLYNGIQLIKH